MFSHRIPQQYVPLVERAIQNALQGVPAGGDWEIILLPAAHTETYLLTGEADETIPVPPPCDDGA